MTQKQLDIYGAYVYNQRCRMEDDISTLQQNLSLAQNICP